MSTLRGTANIIGQGIYKSQATAAHALGEQAATGDGRVFRYSRAGAAALVTGTLLQASAEVTGNQNLTAVAAAIGDTTLVSTSNVTVTANQLAGGYAIITVTPGQGYMYKIKSHAAFTAAAPTLTLEDPIVVALTTSSRIDLVASSYTGLVINPATATSTPVGAAISPIAISEFGWIQTGGVATLLADGTLAVGTNLIASNATAGAVEAGADAADLQASVGVAVSGITTAEYGPVLLSL